MKLDPGHLEILAAVVTAGGLTEGAAAIGKSQPSVSRTISMLEARVATNLFEKGRRPLRPTDLCLTLAAEGRIISESAERASHAIDTYTGGRSGAARVSGTPVFMDGVISNMIAEFQTAFPAVRIDQSYGYPAELMEQLTAGSIDLGICPMNPNQVPGEFVFETILPGRNVIACAPNHPLARKSSLKLADIAAYPWIAPQAGSPLYEDLRNVLKEIGMNNFKVSFSGGSLISIMNVLTGSDALTVLPYSVVFMQKHFRNLVALPIRIKHPDRELGLLRRKDRSERPAVLRFRTHLKQQFVSLSHTIGKQERNSLWRP
jgi:DNA-binding transcriptional LysR family regulator